MRLEFVYVVLAFVLGIIYYSIQKKIVFGELVHSEILLKGMNVDMIFSVLLMAICLLFLLTINGVSDGMEIKYTDEVFAFLLRTPNVKIKSMLWMNISAYVMEAFSAIVGVKISLKSKEHKNLSLEKKLTSDRFVCIACVLLATFEIVFCFLRNY